jgi:hypothetical protein
MRRLSVFLAVIGLVASLAAPSAVAASSRPIEYLALGDSLAFGWDPFVNPYTADFVGYPTPTGSAIRDAVTNASCPGETSSHFISLAGSDHGCGFFRFTAHVPLHVDYTTSQLDFADAFLAAHPKTQLITMDLGANDLGALRDSCPTVEPDRTNCILAGMPAMLATLSTNLDTIYRHIRVDDGYVHKLVGLTIYSPNYSDVPTTWAVSQINQVLIDRTLAWGGIVADGFTSFAAASAAYGGDTCAAGLRIPNPVVPGTCDDHASAVGQDLLAQTIVNALRPD